MDDLFNSSGPIDFTNYTLVIPSVSMGNIPQLTVDLLITTFKMKKVCSIWHPAIVPSTGADPFSSKSQEICTACELYIDQQTKLTVLQIRSALESKLATKFFSDLQKTIAQHKFEQVIILTSAFDYELRTISEEKFYYLSNKNNLINTQCNLKKLEKDTTGKYLLNGSGYAMKLYEVLDPKINCFLLLKYASEGDNRCDAVMMLKIIAKMVGVNDNQITLRMPFSWEFVFGGPAPVGIY